MGAFQGERTCVSLSVKVGEDEQAADDDADVKDRDEDRRHLIMVCHQVEFRETCSPPLVGRVCLRGLVSAPAGSGPASLGFSRAVRL